MPPNPSTGNGPNGWADLCLVQGYSTGEAVRSPVFAVRICACGGFSGEEVIGGLTIIDTIVQSCPINKIDADHATHLTWAILSCMHHFFVRLRTEKGCMEWFKRRQARKAVRTYDKLLQFLTPTHYDTVFSAIMIFLEEADLWEIEYFCSHLFRRVLEYADEESVYTSLLEIVSLVEDSTLTSLMTCREIVQVLVTLGNSVKWEWMDGRILTRIIEIYVLSLLPEENHGLYEGLESSLAACLQAMSQYVGEKHLRCMVNVMFKPVLNERIGGENLLRYGELLESIHLMYTKRGAHHPLSDLTLPPIVKTMCSKKVIYSQLGLRLLQSFVDRCGNKWQFEVPKIFLRHTKYDIIINKYSTADKLMFQRYRHKLHEVAIKCVMMHGVHKLYLELLYICISLFMVEIPCGYTAASGICLVLTLQELARTDKTLPPHYSHRIHAIVISVISLICYVHDAVVLYDYVGSIVEKRATLAPHLNPPLKSTYSYAQHHILWDDPQLFFEDWKIRYGLWRCFKARKKSMVVKKRNFINLPLENYDDFDI
ncbi:hypothetical protein Zmor_022348 [Zophobas morio]|uniref:Uncharacterized protein n=1 Tax=Zophobas morio TaxID=2755281 RepID=A0AA38M5W1_9CUCU|nr:hypothetical protein Zmor_022348 [Zophobas morio]